MSIKRYEKWSSGLSAEGVESQLDELGRIKMLLIDYDGCGTTNSDWNIVLTMEAVLQLRLMHLKESHWYDPILEMFK